MSRWFRHYAGMVRDDKLVRAAIRSKQPVERVVWIWGAILESAAEIDKDGLFEIDAAEVAYFLRADEADVRAVLDGLADAGRVAGDRVVHWNQRQYRSDKSAERQAAYRERKKHPVGGSDDQQKVGDGDVTSLSRHGDAPDTETEVDTETERKKSPAPSSEPEGARDDFDELLSVFPRNHQCSEGRALTAWQATKAKDRPLILAAARRYAAWFLEDCAERDRTPDAGKRYSPFLANWVENGDWRKPLVLKAEANEPDPDLMVLDADDPRLAAIAKRRNRPFVVGMSGRVTVRKSDVEEVAA